MKANKYNKVYIYINIPGGMIEIWPRYVERLTQVSQRTKVLDIFEIHKSFQTAETEWLRSSRACWEEGVEGARQKRLWMPLYGVWILSSGKSSR